jgi:hypothetical protein
MRIVDVQLHGPEHVLEVLLTLRMAIDEVLALVVSRDLGFMG